MSEDPTVYDQSTAIDGGMKQKATREARYVVLYFLVSAGALVLDYALLMLFVKVFEIPLLIANAMSFTAGSVFAYYGSVQWIFDYRRFDSKSVEFVGFVVIGIGALGVNELVLWTAAEWAGFGLTIAKIAASGASFAFNYVARRYIIFSS